jgi:para-aminobenzoate synthetase component I
MFQAILHSPNKILAGEDFVAIHQGDNIEKFKEFAKEQADNYLVGYLSYDLGYELHKIPKTTKDDLNLPKIYFLAYKNLKELKELPKITKSKEKAPEFHSKISKKEYKKAFEKVKEYLYQGEIYQINFSHRLEAKSKMSGKEIFQKITEKNPAQYAAYIEGPNFEILSASPERFIKVENNIIETCPIKGTRPRGKTEKEDQKLLKELLDSPKEKAELNMITDLLRNDVAKVSKPGTRKVIAKRLVQQCPTIWHTYSQITGELKVSPLEALLSMFPGGSITGCPKRPAMKIIDELEENSRGVYTGCIGYIAPNQEYLDFNIAIRSIVKKGENLSLQVGGGLVIDSKMEAEYQETLDKAAAFINLS